MFSLFSLIIRTVAWLAVPVVIICAIDDWGDDRADGFLGDDAFNDFRDFHDRRYSRFSTLKRCAPETASPDFADGSISPSHRRRAGR